MDTHPRRRFAFWTVALFIATAANAGQLASGSLGVTATVVPSISISVDSPAQTFLTSTGVIVPVRISRATTPSRGFTRERLAAGWRYGAPLSITVHQANLSSPTYSVIARLSEPADEDTTWSVNGQRVTSSSSALTGLAAAYGSPQLFQCAVTMRDWTAPFEIENNFVLTIV